METTSMKRRLPKNGTIGITVFGVLVCLWIVGIWTTLPVMGTLHENVKVKIFWDGDLRLPSRRGLRRLPPPVEREVKWRVFRT